MDRTQKKEYVFMKVALTIAQLGTCDRSQVGAVIVRDGRCVSWGFNGAPPGAPHCDENDHGWSNVMGSFDFHSQQAAEEKGCRNATHAEANALAFAAKQGISTEGATLFVTVSPCEVCARLLIAAGITRVVYGIEYRKTDGIDLLKQAGVEVG